MSRQFRAHRGLHFPRADAMLRGPVVRLTRPFQQYSLQGRLRVACASSAFGCRRCPLPRTSRVPERLLTAQETADRLRIKRKTLYNWASTWAVERRGPEPLRMGGRSLRYRESDVAAFIDAMPRAS